MLMEKVNWLRFVILVVCFLSIVVTGCTTREKAKAERATDISSGPSAAAQLLDLSQRVKVARDCLLLGMVVVVVRGE